MNSPSSPFTPDPLLTNLSTKLGQDYLPPPIKSSATKEKVQLV